ncbi:MAG: 3-phosphoshikimate 1-carboxyvinyltransferase [Bacteroidota bacterium]
MNLEITPASSLRGTVTVPGDKSISHRALMIGSLADGLSEVSGFSGAADPKSTQACLKSLGVEFERKSDLLLIHGKGLRGLNKPVGDLDAGNSGTTMRLMAGILAGQTFDSVLIGDESLSRRPMKRVVDPLRQMGARITGTALGTAPISIRGTEKLHAIDYALLVPSAQVKSAILFAGLYADGTTVVREPSKTRDHTERMLDLRVTEKVGVRIVEVEGGKRIPGKKFVVPGDLSSAAFLIAAAMILKNSEVRVSNAGLNPTRTAVLNIFKEMGGKIEIENERLAGGEPFGDIVARSSNLTSDISIRGSKVAALVDEIPILATTALFGEGYFEVRDATELRHKESDRIASIVRNLQILGCDVEEYPDGFAFEAGNELRGGVIDSFLDHRIAMAFGVAGLSIPGITIKGAECVDISFPGFWRILQGLTH